MDEHDRNVVSAVIREWKAISIVQFIELTVCPTHRIAHPARGAALLFLDQDFGAIAAPNPLGHGVFPCGLAGLEGSRAKARSLLVTQEAIHVLVVAF